MASQIAVGPDTSWIGAARDLLLDQQARPCGWGYRPDSAPYAEPTALGALALLAADAEGEADPAAHRAADWLAAIQQADGSVGISADIASPGWCTPYAVLLWTALGAYADARQKAAEWLLATRGKTFPRNDVTGHDPTIAGWPWVAGTHSWLEPTAVAALALHRQGLSGHARVRDGAALICDRATPGGGWNIGNVSTFGSALCPHPAPTGVALLALAALGETHPVVQAGCRYLLRTLPRVRSTRSLGWGLLGLAAWQKQPSAAGVWLAESAARLNTNDTVPLDLAMLLLAASPRSVGLLGAEPAMGSAQS